MIAIDILIEPDVTMTERAKSVNARLRQNYPDGFGLDESHVPHVTLAQRFVRSGDIDALAAELAKALVSGPALPMDLIATGYDVTRYVATAVVVCMVERSPALLELASKVTDVVRPYAVTGGTADSFFRMPGEPIRPETIRYVEEFVPARTGERYEPHVTLGVARLGFVETLLSEPLERFRFSGVNIAIHQLGDFGTARKRLWALAQPR
jgi:2'-5' RNA ligase